MTDPQNHDDTDQRDDAAASSAVDEVQRTYAETAPETGEIEALRAQLDEARQALAHSERSRALDRAFLEAGAVDLPAAHLLLEQLPEIEGEAEAVVAELKRRKPYLFRREPAPPAAPTMSPRPGAGRGPVLDAAYSAMSTGKRAELLQYLRLKRNGQRALSA
jgi:hypothetical protein